MADPEEWFVSEDGCLSIGQPVSGVTYHSSLNTVLVTTTEPAVKVVDVTSGVVLQSSNLSANKADNVKCVYLPNKDKVLFSNGSAVGVRKDFNGMLLLDTGLQTPVSKTTDSIKVELPLPEANHLFKALMSTELPVADYVEDVLRELEKEIEATQQATKGNHKIAKWATVCISLPHCALKTVCNNLVAELKRLNQHIPGLSVAFAVYDRLSYLLPSVVTDFGNGLVDRSLMYSEAARRETFSKWPHMNYKWALPDPMAQAGFYHQPSSTGDDRAMCFTCNVCLVCWEPTDEPWSEHERHSPSCAFVKGEYTQNVPLSVTYATEPAMLHGGKTDKIECVSSSVSDEFVSTSTLNGNVVVWNIERQLKKHIQFNIDPLDPVITTKTRSRLSVSEEGAGESSKTHASEVHPEVPAEAEKNISGEKSASSSGHTAKVIEVSGAWRTKGCSTHGEEIEDVPLHDIEMIKESIQQSRPSQDVRVSSLCMLKSPDSCSVQKGATGSSADSFSNKIKPCLICGVAIRTVCPVDLQTQVTAPQGSSEGNDVAAMNQMNEALSGSTTPQIIPDSPDNLAQSSGDLEINSFMPYLLIHDVSVGQSKESDGHVSQGNFGVGKGSSVSGLQDLYMPQIIEMDEDPDVQIVGVTPPPPMGEVHKSLPKIPEGMVNSMCPSAWVKNGTTSAGISQKIPEGMVNSLCPSTWVKNGTTSAGSSHSKGKEAASISTTSSSGSETESDGGSTYHSYVPPHRNGQVAQCIRFPDYVSSRHYIHCIVPSEDGKFVIVVLAPRLAKKEDPELSSTQFVLDSGEGYSKITDINGSVDPKKAESQNASEETVGGCILVYRLKLDGQILMLEENPVKVMQIDSVNESITSILTLPLDVATMQEEEEISPLNIYKGYKGLYVENNTDYVPGQIAVTTANGSMKIISLDNMKLLAEVSPDEDDRFVSLTFCSGMDRLCACTAEGKLHFYLISPRYPDFVDGELLQQHSPVRPASWTKDTDISSEHVEASSKQDGGEDLLVKQQLSTETLTALHELTQFENLVPRFSATAPPCWTEIQQEQQQRRHPQHLQQRGEATRHTRTWRLQPDSSSWDEHLFEMVLPRPCCIGHIDYKFTLHPLCTSPPNIQVTLLKQNITNIGRQTSIEVDSKIDFNIKPNGNDSANNKSKASVELKTVNNVLDPQFLERHGAEILCGPVDLSTGVDLSGHCGMLTLTSPQLMKVKTRSLLLHVKALHSANNETPQKETKEKNVSNNVATPSTSTHKDKTIKSLFEQFGMPSSGGSMGSAADRLAASKQKLENIKGCDWFQEVSLTVRRMKKTAIPRDRLQRCMVLERPAFHEQLLLTVCSQEDKPNLGSSVEHRQSLALGILTWITYMQMNDPQQRVEESCIVFTIQSSLKALIKACFIEAGRSIAHKCARLLALVIEFTKNVSDLDVAPAFNYALLNALIDSLALIPHATSAGSLHWYFILLNRVKFMDIDMTGQKCADLLITVAKYYQERQRPEHALLKARFGLYGNPLDPDLFDLEPPQVVKLGTSSSGSYAAIVNNNNNNPVSSTQPEEIYYRDLMSITADKSSQKSQADQTKNLFCGLLEVEPLHFTCHATSDGTRMERMDSVGNVTLSSSLPISGLSGTINFTESLSSATAAGAALASLSTAMASAEQQLQMLQQKQQQLMKLQQQKQKLEQKLSETSKMIGTSSAASTQPSSGFSSYSSSPYMYSSELLPPTPKTTPLFMTPPVTPPNEHLHHEADPGKPPSGKSFTKVSNGKAEAVQKPAFPLPQNGQLLQPPAAQVLVIERMHSGARRFVVLDFGKPILLTDMIIPACSDLASLSIDVWVQGEESDGQRLVVSSDIGVRSLVMNDMMPPQICRFLKITTIGRSVGGTTRSRIPIGSFYGHSFILPWELEVLQNSFVPSPLASSTALTSGQMLPSDHSQTLSQLSLLVSLEEDIQCRYSLACNRLQAYLHALESPTSRIGHTLYYLRNMKKSEDDVKITHAYNDCIQLQVQLNLAQRAIQRLQKALGIKPVSVQSVLTIDGSLKEACTDKLRVLMEHLLDCLLGMTNPSTSVPHLPASLQTAFTQQITESLFKHLCIFGTKKMQVHGGTLLVRVSGTEAWWGELLGDILQEYFSSQFSQIFPQDRVFILLTALGQKALTGSSASQVLENILVVLVRLLSPLLSSQNRYYNSGAACLDLSLIGWVLLFLSRNLDSVAFSNNGGEDSDKNCPQGNSSRWDFILGESTMNIGRNNARSNSGKLYRRKLQKRLMHHKQQLLDLQQAKKKFLTTQLEKSSAVLSKEAEALMKQQEQEFRKHLKQYETKHFKDIMRIRRTDGEMLKKLPQEPSSGNGDRENSDADTEPVISLSREKATNVAKGLIALLLSMDFTCDVDLFLVTCKVIARLCTVTRPAIRLCEVMTQEELESLMVLCGSIECNQENMSWGGAWTAHAITCLLQDILEGERLYPNVAPAAEGITDDEMSGSVTESEEISAGTEGDTEASEISNSGTNSSQSKENDPGYKLDKESALIVDMLLEDEVCDDETNAKLTEYLTGESIKQPTSSTLTVSGSGGNTYQVVSISQPVPWGPPNANSTNIDDKKERYDQLRSRLFNLMSSRPSVTQGVSTAMDARLEYGVDTLAEMRLRVMLSLEAESVQTAITAPLPANTAPSSKPAASEDDETAESRNFNSSSPQNLQSSEMLSRCFNNLFLQLPLCRVNLDTLLILWLTLNEDPSHDESSQSGFHPSTTPSIPLNAGSVSSLLQTLAWAPNVPVKSWVLSFQTLSILTNLKCAESGAATSDNKDQWLASVMVADSNLISALVKFLSGSSAHGPVVSGQYTHIGPTATKVFYEFLIRLQLRCAEANENHMKELMLKLVYTLTSESGSFNKGIGPLDAQCKFMDYVLDQNYSKVDINNAISVIESISLLVHQHILSQEPVSCKSSSENSVSARSCFGRLFTSLLHTGESHGVAGDSSRDVLICSLLKLVNALVQMPLPEKVQESLHHGYAGKSVKNKSSMNEDRSAVMRTYEEESPETDEQKTETATHSASSASGSRKPKSCTHFSDVRNPQSNKRESCLSDIILSHQQIISNLLQALSLCNSSAMAVVLGSSGLQSNIQDMVTDMEPLSVGDGIYQVLCTMNRKVSDVKLVLQPILLYLSASYYGYQTAGVTKLSEPLLWYILSVLDCETTLRFFLEMGGIQIVCNNLVSSNRHTINTMPTLISTIMQYLGNSKSSVQTKKTADAENSDGIYNFAPLGTISSSSPTAGLADVLIQASPPHRRARSAAWSYHFYPDEAWVDLTICLPCAILLKNVQIQPHLTSLATCPSYVSVEVSRDGSAPTPVCSPMMTSGLTFIKLQLLKAEVVNTVTIRFHRPRDSTTIGLSQILLMGQTVFGDVGILKSKNMLTFTDDIVSQKSMNWLRLLHHCLIHTEELQPSVAAAATPTPNLLITCCALLVSQSAGVLAPYIETVLLKMGLHNAETGLALIDNLLRNTGTSVHDNGLPLYGKVNGLANESTVEILFQLGMTQNQGTVARVQSLLDWLGECSRVGLQKNSLDSSMNQRSAGQLSHALPAPAPVHIHCIACILWKSQELPVTYDLQKLLRKDLLSSLFEWSTVLTPDSSLKRSVDWVICAMCYIQPYFFSDIMEWMGVMVNLPDVSFTDDLKDSTQYDQESMTDDCKEASGSLNQQRLSSTEPPKSDTGQAEQLHAYTRMILDASHLATLAKACQSQSAQNKLLGSGFLLVLCHGLLEFCLSEVSRYNETVAHPEVFTDALKSMTNSPGKGGSRSGQQSKSAGTEKHLVITADLVAPVLRFYTEVANQVLMKDWLGGKEGSVFWPDLLRLLCNTPSQTVLLHSPAIHKQKVMTSQQRSAIETATVEFFSKVISCHSVNQAVFARVLCDVIKNQGHLHQGIKVNSPLTGFTRRLFLQVLLEDEKILVSFKSAIPIHKGLSNLQMNGIQHPSFGTGHRYCTISTSLSQTCGQTLSKLSNKNTSLLTQQWLDVQEELRPSDNKDTGEVGIEVVDQLSIAVAGLSAYKEKQDKSGVFSSSPSSKKSSSGTDSDQSSMTHSPVLSLNHHMLPGQPLPGGLTLSQFLVLLHERGYPKGHSALNFFVRLRSRKNTAETADWADPVLTPAERISDEVLLDCQPFPSALQVFAGEGGLALLAEHLPLLYPEVTRQVTPQDVSREQGGSGSLGHDWVTVESSEDIYEELYEPMPPSHPSQSSSQNSTVLPTIPPHSLVAFGLFLRLPGYAEVLLKERKQAQCLLRLVLGVTDDGDGGHILNSPMAAVLPTLPFNVLKMLFDSTPLTTDDGMFLRRKALEIRVMHLILACLSVLSHHAPRIPIPGFHQEIIMAATQAAAAMTSFSSTTTATTTTSTSSTTKATDEKSQSYWAKGTGFGTGSTSSSWDAEQALLRQKSEEEHVTCLLQVIASYINPGGGLPKDFESASYGESDDINTSCLPSVLPELLSQSCLVPAISSYLRNDSVLDMARHVPLYRSLLELLRGIAACTVLVPLLLPLDQDDDSQTSVSLLLEKMKTCVDTYTSRLKSNKSKENRNQQEEEEAEGLQLLIPDIQKTAQIVHISTHRVHKHAGPSKMDKESDCDPSTSKLYCSDEQRYMAVMKEYQFDIYEMVVETNNTLKFVISHHYESNVKAAGEVNNAARARRLAQETVTLSTSLPLSASSSVFVRCDEERLDVMKVLITAPSDTPYANGCFEFDVYFPQDYPNSPPLINLETTGNHTVRFNPNLYNDGKVCLSVLNTWHGRPEEKWNSQTSSFLQVLVSIQSLILVAEPYFNEPGYERSRGTPSGTASSREYDANIRQATVKWAMLEMLRNPPLCFKEVIQRHFWLKRREIMQQCEEWIVDMEINSNDKRTGRTISQSCVALKRHYSQLKEEFAKMKVPSNLEETLEDKDTASADFSSLYENKSDNNNSESMQENAKPQKDNANVAGVAMMQTDDVYANGEISMEEEDYDDITPSELGKNLQSSVDC